ncbi:MAG: glycosyltransferase [Caldilineaceae bacterium]
MQQRILHQFTEGVTVGDAISDQAFVVRSWLREAGFTSDIYAVHINPVLAKEARPALNYRPQPGEEYVIYKHSIGSSLTEQLLALPLRFLLVYHNVTPPEFVQSVDPALARQFQQGREQLALLRDRTALALADSPFNEAELRAAGFTNTGVLPITLDESHYQTPVSTKLVEELRNRHPLLLFVGRLTPNKRQEDLLKLLYYYRRIEPNATLALVGAKWLPSYSRWLREVAHNLGLGDNVIITDHVTQAEMVTYFRTADLYVSMSEHEGFGKPLIESMYLGLPVMAYAATSVPSTLGGAGVLFHEKNYEALAEMVDWLIQDKELRQRIITRQRERVQAFLAPQVKQMWAQYLQGLGLL